jgi:hypothetical protein
MPNFWQKASFHSLITEKMRLLGAFHEKATQFYDAVEFWVTTVVL